jgi:hypothetical protein
MPVLLEQHGLEFARMALLYALGYEDRLRSDGVIPHSEGTEEVSKFFEEWANQTASQDLPAKPEMLSHPKIFLRSSVLGCNVIVATANNLASIQLGVLEALFATSLSGHVYPYRSKFQVNVRPSDFITGLPEYRVEYVDGVPELNILHSHSTTFTTADHRVDFRNRILEIVATASSQIAIIDDLPSYFENLAKEEASSVEP